MTFKNQFDDLTKNVNKFLASTKWDVNEIETLKFLRNFPQICEFLKIGSIRVVDLKKLTHQ